MHLEKLMRMANHLGNNWDEDADPLAAQGGGAVDAPAADFPANGR